MLREVRVLQALVTSEGNVHVNVGGAYIAVNGGWWRGRISWSRGRTLQVVKVLVYPRAEWR